MKPKRFHQLWRRLSCLSAILFLHAGCAGFAGNQVPRRAFEDLKPRANRVEVDYDVKYYFLDYPKPEMAEQLNRRIKNTLKESQLFSLATGAGAAPTLHFDFLIKDEGKVRSAVAMGILSGLTLTLVPAHARDNFTVTITVYREGQVAATYEYKDYIDTWIQAFLVFATPFKHPEKVMDQVLDNIVMNFLYDMEKDGLLGP